MKEEICLPEVLSTLLPLQCHYWVVVWLLQKRPADCTKEKWDDMNKRLKEFKLEKCGEQQS